ncbi:MAG TPA: CocE/NonD family hydrolase, partial [Xanthomonadaceae bacterium]|nr:CocE/NonD family hydrolase [Xanthomonadaceae bacterium]
LAHDWYAGGSAWREMDRLDGKPNPIFRSWLAHPSYDAWWQAMIPYRDEFADIDIPVLSTTGYFDGGQVGALYYFDQHTHYRPNADHTLVIGPFGHFTMQTGVDRTIQGYDVDPAAMIDLQQLRFDWFDHVFKGAPKPELLQDRVNYEVMGANVWRHAPTLDAMANDRQRLYFGTQQDAGRYRLADAASKKDEAVAQSVDFKDRGDAAWTPPMDALTPTLDAHGGLVFAGEPAKTATEVEGLFSGELDFAANKRDLDISVALYEQLPDGRYFQLAYYLARASYAQDRTQRHLLTPGTRQHLAFHAGRITARLLQPGSRLVVVLSVPKESDQQINYGTGKDVSDETIADAKEPLRVRWFGDGFIDVPERK